MPYVTKIKKPKPPKPHECSTPTRNTEKYQDGTQWKCFRCKQVWTMKRNHYGRVRWCDYADFCKKPYANKFPCIYQNGHSGSCSQFH